MSKTQQHIIDDDGTREVGNQESATQINDLDREHLRAFPALRKELVMQKIEVIAPTRCATHKGKNEYQKAIINIHRDGYGLIDMQPHDSVFTSLWYRKDRSFLSMGADVTMLLWEDGGNDDDDDSTTMTSWKI